METHYTQFQLLNKNSWAKSGIHNAMTSANAFRKEALYNIYFPSDPANLRKFNKTINPGARGDWDARFRCRESESSEDRSKISAPFLPPQIATVKWRSKTVCTRFSLHLLRLSVFPRSIKLALIPFKVAVALLRLGTATIFLLFNQYPSLNNSFSNLCGYWILLVFDVSVKERLFFLFLNLFWFSLFVRVQFMESFSCGWSG